MSAQIAVIEDGVVDVVYSPDDGGYYLQRTIFSKKSAEVSKRVYPTARVAENAYRNGSVRWER